MKYSKGTVFSKEHFMKKILIAVCVLLAILSVTACSDNNERADVDNAGNQNEIKKRAFTGVITQIIGSTLIIEPNEDEDIRSSGDAVSVVINRDIEKYSAGDTVMVEYDGNIMESYPLQINMLGIEILNEK